MTIKKDFQVETVKTVFFSPFDYRVTSNYGNSGGDERIGDFFF